ncbi:hypothetical protein AB0M20_21750 [Actinoplanes sp. NPDC051633]
MMLDERPSGRQCHGDAGALDQLGARELRLVGPVGFEGPPPFARPSA